MQPIYQTAGDSKSEYCVGYLFFLSTVSARSLTLLEIIRDGVYNVGSTSLTPISIAAGYCTYNPLFSSQHLHQSRDAIKTKITVQCNQWRIRGSFSLKHCSRLPVEIIVLPRAGSATEIASRLPDAKRARRHLRIEINWEKSVTHVFSLYALQLYSHARMRICMSRILLSIRNSTYVRNKSFFCFSCFLCQEEKLKIKSNKFSLNLL